jgi:hypothetical protein
MKNLGILIALVPALALVGCGGSPDTTPTESSAAPAAAPPDTPTPAAAVPAAGSASITGKVTYEGDVPKLKPVAMGADPDCAAKHSGPVASEVLVLGDDGSLANVYVRVKDGLPDGTWPAPAEPVVLDQHGCRYVPHVLGVMVDQPFKILNSDGLLHNVHALPKINKQFNMAMPASRTEAIETFNRVEDIFTIKCDVHPWMQAYVAVSAHPFFAVTDTSGRFRIEELPAGTYEIEAWHEKLGTRTAAVTLGEGASEDLELVFER